MSNLQKKKQIYFTKLILRRIKQRKIKSALMHLSNLAIYDCSSKRIGDLFKLLDMGVIYA